MKNAFVNTAEKNSEMFEITIVDDEEFVYKNVESVPRNGEVFQLNGQRRSVDFVSYDFDQEPARIYVYSRITGWESQITTPNSTL